MAKSFGELEENVEALRSTQPPPSANDDKEGENNTQEETPTAISEGEQPHPSLVRGRVEDNDDNDEKDNLMIKEEEEEDGRMPEIPDQECDGMDDDDDGFVFQRNPRPSKGDSNKGAHSSKGEDLSTIISRQRKISSWISISKDDILGPEPELDPTLDLSMLNLTLLVSKSYVVGEVIGNPKYGIIFVDYNEDSSFRDTLRFIFVPLFVLNIFFPIAS
ncbi:hypothetical protein L6452_01452 [Arctium lappa]|uniref:Uncharacterized protein n=1 Tax=Arctium lappa TaxID=4217 RepID=A0ACB9FGC2_ARCLA|nr:hypothetical protein L6452_01452 [Arctium lappa]